MSDAPRPLACIVLVLVIGPALAGCIAPAADPPCAATQMLRRGLDALQRQAGPDGGVPNQEDGRPDPRTTAWVLTAAALARRSGYEGAFEADPHVGYLRDAARSMLQEGTPIDSAANNASLVRLALQLWGVPPEAVSVHDPEHEEVDNLRAAWDARFDPATGRYGARLNEHLFAGFAAWLFGPADDTRAAIQGATERLAQNETMWDDGLPFAHDAWFVAYARLAVGPEPDNHTLDVHLDQVLRRHQSDDGGVRGFASASNPDASTTAAALMAWRVDGVSATDPRVQAALGYLCALVRSDGSFPFSATVDAPVVKTTAEVVIALALLVQPVPWGTLPPPA